MLFFLWFPLFTQASTLTARVDRTEIHPDETFTLVLTLDAQTDQEPDFSVLKKDFYILGSAHSERRLIENDQAQAQTEWKLMLSPKTKGILTLPPLKLGNLSTSPITISVEKNTSTSESVPTDAQHVFMRTEIDKNEVYLQSQLTYTIKIYYDVNLRNVSIDNPQIDSGQIFSMGTDKDYQANVAGHPYQVIERRFAIFPDKPGSFTIKPPVLVGQYHTSSDPIAAFDATLSFDDPLGKTIRTAGQQQTLQVLPIPEKLKDLPWLPSPHVTLSDSWKSPEPTAKVGEPLVRTLTVRASGVAASQIPAFSFPEIPGFKIYPERPELTNDVEGSVLVATRKQSFTFIPTHEGITMIPAESLTSWILPS